MSLAVSYHGQRMQLDLLLHGKATLAGHVYAADGVTPLSGAVVRAMNPSEDPNQSYRARADENGAYVIDSIPAGNLIVEAAHQQPSPNGYSPPACPLPAAR